MIKILVRPTSDKNVREYHFVGTRISEMPYAPFHRPTWGTESEFPKLGPIGEKIAEALMNPDQGDVIEKIAFLPESLRVSKSAMASWGTLEPHVIMPAFEEALDSRLEIQPFGRTEQRQLAHA